MIECTPDTKAPRYTSGALSRRALRLVHRYIEQNLAEPITLGDLARVAGLSRFHFCRRFRSSTAQSPMRYLQRYRLEYAKQLLTHHELTIAEIAAMAGFCDESHFSRRFRELTGMPPRDFARGIGRSEGAEAKRTLASRASVPNVGVRYRSSTQQSLETRRE
jgi:AraC family transcriptional regulator